jgi:choline transport protein
MLLLLLNIASTAAFGAFIALSSLGLMASYSIAIGCMLHVRFRKEPVQLGGWTLGRWGLPINSFTLIFTLYITAFLPFPSTLPVTGTSMNYALSIFVFTNVLALGLWIFWAQKNWKGLDLDVIPYIIAESERGCASREPRPH